jgi:hypothetical protein
MYLRSQGTLCYLSFSSISLVLVALDLEDEQSMGLEDLIELFHHVD